MIIVTGGAGFIGSNFVASRLAGSVEPVLIVDKLTHAGNLENLASVRNDARLPFRAADICDQPAMEQLLQQHSPRAIIHFAAASHVDRSIHGPGGIRQDQCQQHFQSAAADPQPLGDSLPAAAVFP